MDEALVPRTSHRQLRLKIAASSDAQGAALETDEANGVTKPSVLLFRPLFFPNTIALYRRAQEPRASS